ncbi:MAG: DUF5668 domain-containing protein [Anaerolineae bacterium]|nr:DUF5668 domain-containing protein [Anaerolineae bacterium]
MRSQSDRAPRLWPLVITAVGVLLLLSNFRLLTFDVVQLWPLLVIALGIQLLRQGDFGLSWQGQTFGITRGSVERATLEADAGELDLNLRALRKEGRLVAGQYTARSRPSLEVQHNEATLRMRRGQTWLLSLADWEVGLARDLPWRLLLSAHLGVLSIDLSEVEIEEARLATGIGDIRLVCPGIPSGPIWARSTLGNISVEVPAHVAAAVRVRSTALSNVKASDRFSKVAPGLWVTEGYADSDGSGALSVEVESVVGDVAIT